MKFILLFIIATFPVIAFADDVVKKNIDIDATAFLSWEAPETRVDGSDLNLNEIGGYRLYSGATESDLSMLIDLEPGTLMYTDTLAQGVTYYAVSVYDTYGVESELSHIRGVEAFVPKPAPSQLTLEIQ